MTDKETKKLEREISKKLNQALKGLFGAKKKSAKKKKPPKGAKTQGELL